MRTSPSRLLVATAILAVATTLGACAQPEPGATTAPDRPESTPAGSATPTATSPAGEPSGEPGSPGIATPPAGAVELVDFETQNGSMRMRIPADWVVDDSSRVATFPDGQGWSNELAIAVPDAGVLSYTDGLWGDTGAENQTGVVEQIAIGHGLAAAAWWEAAGDGTYTVATGIVEAGGVPFHVFRLDDHERLYSMTYYDDAQGGFASQAAAEEHLAGDTVGLVLDVLATVEFSDDQESLPQGVGVEHEGTTYLPYTTRNGSATFLVPQDWHIRDDSRASTNMAGQQVWENAVTIADVDGGGAMLGYYDMEFTNWVEELEWTLGEVRPTTENPQWQAVSWALGDAVPHQGGHVGVSLTDRNGTERPADRVCSERMCRDFSSLPLSPSYFGGELASTADFFGSASEERMLTVVASLQTHHEDPTRMP